MAVVAITGGPGAPGATSSALALLLSWPLAEGRRVLLLEADPDGGAVLAGALQGQVEAGAGLRNLALAERRGRLLETMWEQCLDLSPDRAGDRLLLPGLSDPAQAAALAMTWDPLAEACQALDAFGCDVLVDLGRSGGLGPSGVLARRADLVVTVLRTTLRGLSAARPRVAALAEELNEEGRADALGLLLIQQGPYSGGETSRALSTPVLGVLPHAPKEAHTLSDGGRTGDRRFLRSQLMRAARTAADDLHKIAAARRQQFTARTAVAPAGAAAETIGASGGPEVAPEAPIAPAVAPASGPRHAGAPQAERPQPVHAAGVPAMPAVPAVPDPHQVPMQAPLAPPAQPLGYRPALSQVGGQAPGQALNGQASTGQALNGYAGYGQAALGQGSVNQAGPGQGGTHQATSARALNGQSGYPQALPGQGLPSTGLPGREQRAPGQLGSRHAGGARPSHGHAPNGRPSNGQAAQGQSVPGQPVPASGDPGRRPWSVQDVMRLAASARLDGEYPGPIDAVHADPSVESVAGLPGRPNVPGTSTPVGAPGEPAVPGAPSGSGAATSVTPGQAARLRAVQLEPEGALGAGAEGPRHSYRPAGAGAGPFAPVDDRDWFTPLHIAPPPPLAEHAPRPPVPQQFQHLAPPVPQAQPAARQPGGDVPPNDTPPTGEVAHVR